MDIALDKSPINGAGQEISGIRRQSPAPEALACPSTFVFHPNPNFGVFQGSKWPKQIR